MSVRFSNMWSCIAIWIALDLLMIWCGKDMPSWIAFDGVTALRHDSFTVIFIIWMWIAYREPSSISSTDGKSHG